MSQEIDGSPIATRNGKPPPALPKHAQAVSNALAGWPEVHARTHWMLGDEREVDGADFLSR